ncbi:MAG: glycosyl transferase [Leptospiraceae bacterium]|nr:glycosyl transferase [Leptospiraceae bacterium]
MNIAYYVSGHGFGHISRSYEVIKYFLEKEENCRIFVNTTRKDFVKEQRERLFFRDVAVDVGMVQLTSISLDVSKTLEAIFEFEKEKSNLVEKEISFLQEEKIDCIISDSSSLPFVFAAKLNLPSYFLGNFTWDFIYQNYVKNNSYFQKYSNDLREEYALCKLGFILPFHCPMDSILRKKNIGIIGRNSFLEREEIRRLIGFSPEIEYFLFSFGAYGISAKFHFENLQENQRIVVSGYEGLTGEKILDIKNFAYPDIVKACDYVLTKPGYGILSETYYAKTPVIYTDRGDFAEYSYLVQALETYHYSAYIPQNDLLLFSLEKAKNKIEYQKKIKSIPLLRDGREEIYQEIFL